jgi:hypothetical protein
LLSKVDRTLEEVSFPVEEVIRLLGGADDENSLGSFLQALAQSLQVPFGSLWLGLIAVSGFESHRTVAQYTPILHSQGFPYLGNIGRSGDGKSKVVWLLKQIVKEREKRDTSLKMSEWRGDGDGEEHALGEDAAADAGPAADVRAVAEQRPNKRRKVAPPRKTPQPTNWVWDTGTLHGAATVMSVNGERCMALLHEGQKILKDLLADAPGSRADSFVKLYDIDDYTNAVLSSGSHFQNDFPCFIVYMALHLEDYYSLFGADSEDPAGIRWRVDWFRIIGLVPTLKDFGKLEQDATIELLADLCELINDQFPLLKDKEARRMPGYSRRLTRGGSRKKAGISDSISKPTRSSRGEPKTRCKTTSLRPSIRR